MITNSELLALEKLYKFPWHGDFNPNSLKKYLGCPLRISLSLKQNLAWCLRKIEGKFVKWKSEELSLLSRLVVVKHMLKPCLVYVKSMLSFYKYRLDRTISDFVWENQWHSIG